MIQIKEGIWFIEAEFRGRFPYAHALYIGGNQRLLIDTGAGLILEKLSGKVDRVLLSHYHRDHVSGNHLFPDVSFSIHEKDAPGVESVESFYQLSGLGKYDFASPWRMEKLFSFNSTQVDHYLSDNERIALGKINLTVLHLPGHTPGHCAFLIEEYGIVFAADIDLTSFGPWYGNPSSDLENFRLSIRRLRDLKPTMLITSHSMPTSDRIDQQLAIYGSALEQRDEALLKLLRERPRTLEQITAKKIIYRNHDSKSVFRFFEENMIRKHLESFEKEGLVRRTEAGCYEVL
ncbi:MAG TPA: MBL fold metallo-hydrolase [Candidatus Limnocylindrales bacterium]|nr:MBL fold metallo-hydrolase [Candidatus Limnocylindrales bacterium]